MKHGGEGHSDILEKDKLDSTWNQDSGKKERFTEQSEAMDQA